MDAWYKKRNKCRWWRKKYKVKAKIKKNGGSSFGGYNKGCTYANISTYQQDYCNDYLVIAAASGAEAGDYVVNYASEYVHHDCNWTAGVDVDFKFPEHSTLPMYSKLGGENHSESYGAKISNNDVVFIKNSSIVIDDFSLSLSVNPIDFSNHYSVGMITIEEAVDDDDKSQGKLYWSAKAFIYNGILILEGGFKEIKSLNVKENAKGSYEITADKISVNTAELGINNFDDIEVGFYVDNGNLGIGIPEIYSIDFRKNTKVSEINTQLIQQANVNFNVFPTPTNDVINLSYEGKEEMIFEIRLTDLQGNIVAVLAEKELLAPNKKKQFNLSSFENGVYLVQLISGNDIYSRKIIKQ